MLLSTNEIIASDHLEVNDDFSSSGLFDNLWSALYPSNIVAAETINPAVGAVHNKKGDNIIPNKVNVALSSPSTDVTLESLINVQIPPTASPIAKSIATGVANSAKPAAAANRSAPSMMSSV